MGLSGRFDNGVLIDPVFASLYASARPKERVRFGDWRRVVGPGTFWEWATAPRANGGPSRLQTALAAAEDAEAREAPRGSVVVGATCAPYKLGRERDVLAWMSVQEAMAADARAVGLDLAWFAAIEDDPSHPRWAAFTDRLDACWSFAIDTGAARIDSGERLVRICTGRNLIAEYAMRRDADWILFLDTDLTPAPDTVSKLLALNWPIVGGTVPAYNLSGPKIRELARVNHWGGIRYDFPVQAHWNTAGYLMVHREVYRKLRWRIDPPLTDDPCYAFDAVQLGYPTMVRKDVVGNLAPPALIESHNSSSYYIAPAFKGTNVNRDGAFVAPIEQLQHLWHQGEQVGAFVARSAIENPVGTLRFRDAPAGPTTIRISLASRLIETIRLRFESSDGGFHDLVINTECPYLMYHDLAHVTATKAAIGELLLDCDLELAPGARLAAVHVLLDNEANWRFNPFVVSGPIKAPVVAPEGATVLLTVRSLLAREQIRRRYPFGTFLPPYRSDYRKDGKRPRDVVLFASWVPESALAIGQYYLDMLSRHHHDSRILVGVNRGSSPAWIDMIHSCPLDIAICEPPSTLDLDSDAAGYIATLQRLKAEQEAFDLVWFIHTKGASSPLDHVYAETRWTFEKRFWSQRMRIDEVFQDQKVGIYAPHWIPPNTPPNREIDALSSMVPSRLRPIGLMALATSYVMRANVVRHFCDVVPAEFFAVGPGPFSGSRFFFESGMPSLPSLLGYEPFIEDGVGATAGDKLGEEDAFVWADERQNHQLVRRIADKWRSDPEGYTLKYHTGVQASELPKAQKSGI